jgi:NADH-ubiquinone oxidoreductase chain 5
MYLSIIVLPLLGSLVSGFLGRKVGITGSQIVSCGSLIITSILISIAFYEVGLCGSPVYINLGTWLDSEMLQVSWEFYFDQLTVSLGLAVIYCSTLIHIYTIDYLAGDAHGQRFFSYLSAFTGGMLILICGGNYFVMFVGWEAIGVVSYLLINFYFTRIQANKAAILAFTMNRSGDMLISIGFFAIFALFGTYNYSQIFTLVPYMNELSISIISLLLLGGALAKSANIPLHSWLPGSMEAWLFYGTIKILLILYFYISSENFQDICCLSTILPTSYKQLDKSTLHTITGNMLGDGSLRLTRP